MNAKTCEGCKFAVLENGTQVGCAINKLERFKKSGQAILKKLSYTYNLSRVCIYKRQEEWEGDIEAETALRMGYIFILKDFDKLSILGESLRKVKPLNPTWIGIVHTCVANHKEVIEEMNAVGNKYFNVVMQLSQTQDFDKIDSFYKNIPQGWTLVNIVGEELKIDAKSTIEKEVNDNLKAISAVKFSDDTVNGVCINNFFYRMLGGSFPIVDEENQTIFYKSILEKITEAHPDGVYTWSELNG